MVRTQRSLQQLLSQARMTPYTHACAGDWEKAVDLYDWNTKVSAAFFESLHYVERGLRNALDNAASAHLGATWLSHTSTILSARSRHVVLTAFGHAGGANPPHGKVVAELPFGFWWSLLADEYNRRLWQPALQHAFEAPVRRRRLHADLDELRQLRNRIAHHEPVHTRDLDADFGRLVDVSTRVGRALGTHVVHTTRVPAVLADRPVAQ